LPAAALTLEAPDDDIFHHANSRSHAAHRRPHLRVAVIPAEAVAYRARVKRCAAQELTALLGHVGFVAHCGPDVLPFIPGFALMPGRCRA
jgi:hypothetical protein